MNQSRSLKTRHLALACILGASTLAAVEVTKPQPRWGKPATPSSGACFYRAPDFRGNYFCANSGENISFLSRGMSGQIASIRSFGDTKVTIFQNSGYEGRWTRLEGDVRDLRGEGWNDPLSSLRIDNGDGYPRKRGLSGDGQDSSGIGRIETGAWSDGPTAGTDGAGLGQKDAPERNEGWIVDRREPWDPQGATALGTPPVDAAEVMVRGAYKDILLREPDPQGLTLYRNRINHEKWSEQDVRDALLKSPEYRQRIAATPQQNAEALVARAYRSVLGREPDPASRVYVDKVLREHWTEAQVSRDLRNSPEYRSKH